jgi:hypothetical protein
MGYKAELVAPPQIEHAILLIRGQRVLLDRDLAAMYGVTTGNLNKAVRRNLSRFPADFMFQLTEDEAEASRFQIGILKRGLNFKHLPNIFSGISIHARPHPDPLPGKRESAITSPNNFSILVAITDSVLFAVRHRITQAYRMVQNAANDSPSPGGEGRGEGGRLP